MNARAVAPDDENQDNLDVGKREPQDADSETSTADDLTIAREVCALRHEIASYLF
jgi:hypothetical protein